MKIDLSSVPKEFIDGITTVKIRENFDAKDRLRTKGNVHVYRYRDGYLVECGATYMDRKGVFTIQPLEELDDDDFYEERLFRSLEEAWNTFVTHHNSYTD